MHVEKIKSSQVSGLMAHDMRTTNNHSNKDIDVSRSHLNYNLHPGDPMKLLSDRLGGLDYVAKKSLNVLVSWAVTAPAGIELEVQEEFLREMFLFFKERYGEENVVSAYVHLDETTPHMHFKFVPVLKEKGLERLTAKDVINRKELMTIHKDAEKAMSKKFGIAGMVLNGATANGNKTIVELKLETALKELEVKSAHLEQVVSRLDSLEEDLPEEKPLFEEKKGLFGKVVPGSEYNALVNDFNELLSTERDRVRTINLWKRDYSSLKGRFGALEHDFKSFRELDLPREVLMLRESNTWLKKENESLLEEIDQLNEDLSLVNSRLRLFGEVLNEWLENIRGVSENWLIELIRVFPERGREFLSGIYTWFEKGFERD